MSKPTVIAAVALLAAAVGCGQADVREIVPTGGEQQDQERENPEEEPPVPGAEEPVSSPEPTDPAADPTGGPDPAPAPGEPEETGTGEAEEEDVPDEAAEYMTALTASDDPERMREGLTLTAEDSTAHTYLRHYVQVYSAWESAGHSYAPSDLTPSEEGFELCLPGSGGPPVCAFFSRFTVEDGLITGFLVNGQDPGKRLVSGHGVAASSEGVDVHMLTAYQSITDDVLVVTAEFTTVDDVDLDLFGATYTAPDGREYRAEEAVGEYRLDAGTAVQTALFFTGPEVGGDLAVTGCLDECFAFVDLEFPVD